MAEGEDRRGHGRVVSRGIVESIVPHSSLPVLSVHASYGPIFAGILRIGLSCVFMNGCRVRPKSRGLALGVSGGVDDSVGIS